MLKRIAATVALASLTACAGSEAGRYSAALGKKDAAQERLDRAAAELVAARQECAETVSDGCVATAQRLSAELADAKAQRDAAAADIAAARQAQAEAFGQGLAVLQDAQGAAEVGAR